MTVLLRYKSKIFNHIDCRPAVDIRLHIETRIYIVGYKSLIEIIKYLQNSLGIRYPGFVPSSHETGIYLLVHQSCSRLTKIRRLQVTH